MPKSVFVSRRLIAAGLVIACALWTYNAALLGFFRAFGMPVSQIETGSLVEAPKNLGALAPGGQARRINLQFNFCPANSSGYQDLFQTDDVNTGVRAELGGGTLAIIYRTHERPDAPSALVLSNDIQPGKCYDLKVSVADRLALSARIDGSIAAEAANPIVPLTNVRIGVGFDDTRVFQGTIRNVDLTIQPLRSPRTAQLVTRALAFLVWVGILSALCWNLWMLWIRIRYVAWGTVDVRPLPNILLFTSSAFAAIGVAYRVVWRIADSAYAGVQADVSPTIVQSASYFKAELIGFVLISGLSALLALMIFQSNVLSAKAAGVRLPAFVMIGAAACFALGASLPGSAFPRIALAVAAALAVSSWVTGRVAFGAVANLAGFLWRMFRSDNGPGALKPVETVKTKKGWMIASLLVGLAFSVGAGLKLTNAWYPVQILPDYYELPLAISTSHGTELTSTESLLKCLPGSKSADECPIPEADRADFERMIPGLYNWQVETGRLLFHHSYMLIPLKALFEYGWHTKVPFLYGIGNTMLPALITGGNPSITSYFEAIPKLVFCALMIIALTVGFATRQVLLIPVAFLAGLATYFSIDFVAIYLAASFNPSRYIGVSIQIASVFFVARGTRSQIVALPLALAFSLVWNTEFALIGLIAQSLILASPNLWASFVARGACFLSLLALVVVSHKISVAPADMFQTIELGFYNYVTPALDRDGILTLYICLIAGLALLIGLAMQFDAVERDARLAIIPVLALLHIKYIFNPAEPHLLFVWIFVVPVTLAYIPWREIAPTPKAHKASLLLAIVFTGIAAWRAGNGFDQASRNYKQTVESHFDLQKWTSLGETFEIAQPEQGLLTRVSSLRSRITPGQKTVVFSPFDHLLAIYAPPADFCGHFEAFSNFVLRSHAGKLDECLRRSPGAVVIYDKALDIDCPAEGRLSPMLDQRCTRFEMKSNLRDIFKTIEPRLTKFAEDGPLTYYHYSKTDSSDKAP